MTTISVLVVAQIIPGIHYDTWQGLLIATLLLGLINTFIKPAIMFLALPFRILSLGLFTLIINAALLYFVGSIVKDFHVDSFGKAFWGALLISVFSTILNLLTGTGSAKLEVRKGQVNPPPPGPRRDDDTGSGPVIDV